MTSKIGIMFTTVGLFEDANEISKILLKEKLIACTLIDKIQSMYEWKGVIQIEDEFRLMIKYPIENQDKIINKIDEVHPYEVPEIVYWTIKVNEKYRQWCYNVTKT